MIRRSFRIPAAVLGLTFVLSSCSDDVPSHYIGTTKSRVERGAYLLESSGTHRQLRFDAGLARYLVNDGREFQAIDTEGNINNKTFIHFTPYHDRYLFDLQIEELRLQGRPYQFRGELQRRKSPDNRIIYGIIHHPSIYSWSELEFEVHGDTFSGGDLSNTAISMYFAQNQAYGYPFDFDEFEYEFLPALGQAAQ